MTKVKLKKVAATLAKAAAPIVATIVLSRLTTGKLDTKGALLDAIEGAARAAKAKRSEATR